MSPPLNTPPHSGRESWSVEDNDNDGEEVVFVDGDAYDIVGDSNHVSEIEDDAGSDMDDVLPLLDDCKAILKKHTESVFCVAISPNSALIASGAQDHTAVLWDAHTGSELFSCLGHQDSVISVAFSLNSEFLATGDMAGEILIWSIKNTANSDMEAICSLHSSHSLGDLSWLRWWAPPQRNSTHSDSRYGAVSSRAQILLAGTEDGMVTIFLVSKGSERPPKYLMGPGSCAVAAEFVPSTLASDRPYLAVIYRSGDFRVWDLKGEQACLIASLPLPTVMATSGGDNDQEMGAAEFTCMAAPRFVAPNADSPHDIVAVGGLGQFILVPCKPPRNIDTADSYSMSSKQIATNSLTVFAVNSETTVEAIDFSWTHPFLAYATVDGEIGIYNTNYMRLRQRWTYKDPEFSTDAGVGITVIRWSQTEPIFYTGTLAGTVVAWRGLSEEPLASEAFDHSISPLMTWRGHSETVLDFALSPVVQTHTARNNAERAEHAFFVTASDDSTLRIFSLS